MDPNNSIRCSSGNGPSFGDKEAFIIHDNCLSDKVNRSKNETSYGDNLGLTEDENFSLDELEVLLLETD